MTKQMSIYALGHRGYVELRRASKPPRAETSKAIRKGVVKEYGYDYSEGHVRWVLLERPYTHNIIITSWIGGRPLKTIPSKSFADKTGHGLRQGAIWVVPSEVATRLLGEKHE